MRLDLFDVLFCPFATHDFLRRRLSCFLSHSKLLVWSNGLLPHIKFVASCTSSRARDPELHRSDCVASQPTASQRTRITNIPENCRSMGSERATAPAYSRLSI